MSIPLESRNRITDVQKQRLNQLIELISDQEAKLNRLKALRKLAKDQTAINAELNNELKTVNSSLNEKDEELRQALNRVDNLDRQLNNYRKTRKKADKEHKLTPNDSNDANTKDLSTNNGSEFSSPVQVKEQQDLKQTVPGDSEKKIDDYQNNKNSNSISSSSTEYTSCTSNNCATNDAPSNCANFVQNHPSPAINKYATARQKLVGLDLKNKSNNNGRRVSFDPLALLLDAALEGELELVIETSKQVPDLSASHDECVTALHNAVVADRYEVAKYLIEAGCDINVQDSDGWTPLHCAASNNNLPLVKLLIENGALIYATTTSDNSTPAMKCDKNENGFEDCYKYLMYVQNNLGIINNGVVFALYDYEAQEEDELSFTTNEELVVLRRDDSQEQEWWWAQKRIQQSSDTMVDIKEGYVPRNLFGLYPRVKAFRKTIPNDTSTDSNGNEETTK